MFDISHEDFLAYILKSYMKTKKALEGLLGLLGSFAAFLLFLAAGFVCFLFTASLKAQSKIYTVLSDLIRLYGHENRFESGIEKLYFISKKKTHLASAFFDVDFPPFMAKSEILKRIRV